MLSARQCAMPIIAAAGMMFIFGCFESPSDPDAGKPRIIVNPQDDAVVFGDTVRFTVVATGEGTITFRWFKSGSEIAAATDSSLKLNDVTFADTGDYYVVVTNASGAATSDTAHLAVSGGEPVIGKQSLSVTVGIGDSVSFFVQAAGNFPFTYAWLKNDSLITGADDSVLKIASVSKQNFGNYRAIVTNSVGLDTSEPMSVILASGTLFIAQTDYQSGLLEWMSTGDAAIASSHLSIYSDAALRSFGGYVYVIERFGADNILKFDPSKSDASGVLYQKHLGDNWNPQDIEFVSETKAYISQGNQPEITIFNPATGTATGRIDLSAYTFMPDSNTSPNAGDLQLVGSDLYVMLQRRNGFNPGAPTLILKINTATEAVTDTIPLRYKNGYATAYADGALYTSSPGSSFVTGDGAIEKIDLASNTVSTVIDETTLGGSPNDIVHKSGSHFYVISYIGWKDVKVIEVDAAAGTVAATLPGVKDAFGGIYFDDIDELLYVGERDSVDLGIRIFKNNEQVGAPVKSSNSLPPIGLAVVR